MGLANRRIKSEYRDVHGLVQIAAQSPLIEAKRRARYFELATRSILNRCSSSAMPFTWTINPYRGCEFGCRYCYARRTHQYLGIEDPSEFETRIYAKSNIPVLLRHELRKANRRQAITVGTATDVYQPAERRFGRTRAVWQVFAAERGWRLSVVTKSDLILRDLELLKAVAQANVLHVYLTITTLDEGLARILEPLAPRPALRLAAIETLAAAGLSVGAFPNPILPYLTDSEQNLDQVARAVAGAGATFLGGGVLYLAEDTRRYFFDFLARHFPALRAEYERLFRGRTFLRGRYLETIRERVAAVRDRHHLSATPLDYKPPLWEGEEQLSLFSETEPEWTSRTSITNCQTG